jgi:acyl carrier protein
MMGERMDRDEIFERVRRILVETFELDPASISLGSRLMEELDLDSIDAVDLVVKLQQYTTTKIDPSVFKQVRTVGDVVDAILPLVEGASGVAQ